MHRPLYTSAQTWQTQHISRVITASTLPAFNPASAKFTNLSIPSYCGVSFIRSARWFYNFSLQRDTPTQLRGFTNIVHLYSLKIKISSLLFHIKFCLTSSRSPRTRISKFERPSSAYRPLVNKYENGEPIPSIFVVEDGVRTWVTTSWIAKEIGLD